MSHATCILVGNLGQDPDLKYTTNGTPICSFSMATSEKRKDPKTGEKQEKTTWWRVTFFGKQAEIISQYMSKGKLIYVEGRPRQEEWTDRDGKARTSLEVFGTDFTFIGDGGGQQGGSQQGRSSPRQEAREARAQQPAGGLNLDDNPVPF